MMENPHTEEIGPERHTPDLADDKTRTTPTTTIISTSGRNFSQRQKSVNDGDSPLDLVLARLEWTRSGAGYSAKCPAHNDTNPSLSVTEKDDGSVLVHCHTGCASTEIVKAMRLTMADLFPRTSTARAPRVVETYDYQDENGTLLFQSVRFDPKNFKQQRPDGKGGWVWNLKGIRRVLYRLPELRHAETVYIPEGEKDVDTLRGWGLVATCNPGGAGKWRPEYAEALRGKHVLVFPDNDEAGEKHALQVARALLPVAASVKVVRLPNLPAKGDVSDWRNAGHTKAELLALGEAALPWKAEAGKDDLPAILITTDITTVVNEAEAALLTLANGPHLFQRINQLCFVTHSATPPKWLKRPVGAPSIAACSLARLREYMSRAAQWVKQTARSKESTPALPPSWAVETLHGRQEWGFPILADVIASPTLREDGEIISAAGYDPDTGLFLDTQGVIFPEIPKQPTLDEARRAVKALTEPFADFPFAGEDKESKESAARSATLSAILSLVARPAINSCVPLFAVDSTTRGTGKGLLIDVVSTIATGRAAPRWAQARDEEEDRKALLTIGVEGDSCCHIDNLTRALGSGALDSALTAGVIKGRLLGLNKSAEVPMTCVFFASGNNISYAGDTSRRVVPIQLESLEEHPENRVNFQQPRLLEWVRQERPRLAVEALTLLRAYFVAGCPKQGISAYGSFEAWSDLIRSALIWTGCPDPCGGRKDIEAASDPGYENLASLLHLWEACYPNEAATLNRVIGDVGLRSDDPPPNKWRDLREALAAFDSRYDGKHLNKQLIGNALRTQKGRVIDGLRLIHHGKLDHAVQWVVQKV